jgi:hypothetical protein
LTKWLFANLAEDFAEEAVAAEDYCPELGVIVKYGVLEGDYSGEGAAVETRGAVKHGPSEPGLSPELGAVENHILFELDLSSKAHLSKTSDWASVKTL